MSRAAADNLSMQGDLNLRNIAGSVQPSYGLSQGETLRNCQAMAQCPEARIAGAGLCSGGS